MKRTPGGRRKGDKGDIRANAKETPGSQKADARQARGGSRYAEERLGESCGRQRGQVRALMAGKETAGEACGGYKKQKPQRQKGD